MRFTTPTLGKPDEAPDPEVRIYLSPYGDGRRVELRGTDGVNHKLIAVFHDGQMTLVDHAEMDGLKTDALGHIVVSMTTEGK